MKTPSKTIALAAALLVATPVIGRPPPPPPEDTFNLTVTPGRSLYDWSLVVVRESGFTGIYNYTLLTSFPDLEGVVDDFGTTYPTYTSPVTLTRPDGVGNFGYFIIGRYQTELPPDTEAGVTIGMNQTSGGTFITDATDWATAFPGSTEYTVFTDIGTGWGTSGSANNTFLGQLFNLSVQSANPIGSVGGPTSLDLTLVTFSEADAGGTALLFVNVPESSTLAAGFLVLGGGGMLLWRRSRRQA